MNIHIIHRHLLVSSGRSNLSPFWRLGLQSSTTLPAEREVLGRTKTWGISSSDEKRHKLRSTCVSQRVCFIFRWLLQKHHTILSTLSNKLGMPVGLAPIRGKSPKKPDDVRRWAPNGVVAKSMKWSNGCWFNYSLSFHITIGFYLT